MQLMSKASEELALIESNLGGCILNLIELMDNDEMDVYLGDHVSFIVFAE